LPWLAWERSVENFDAAINEEQQRELIKTSIRVHRRKGTVAAVREVFRALGPVKSRSRRATTTTWQTEP
jgi:phage tail P2-like protein